MKAWVQAMVENAIEHRFANVVLAAVHATILRHDQGLQNMTISASTPTTNIAMHTRHMPQQERHFVPRSSIAEYSHATNENALDERSNMNSFRDMQH